MHTFCKRALEKSHHALVFCLLFSLAKPSQTRATPLLTQPAADRSFSVQPSKLSFEFAWGPSVDALVEDKEKGVEVKADAKPRLGVSAGHYYRVGTKAWVGPELGVRYGFTKNVSFSFERSHGAKFREKAFYIPVALRWGNEGLFAHEWGRSFALGYEFSYHWGTELTLPQASVARKLPPSLSGSFFLEGTYEVPMGLSFYGKLKAPTELLGLRTYLKALQQGTMPRKDEVIASFMRLVSSNVCELGLGLNFAHWIIDQPSEAPARHPL